MGEIEQIRAWQEQERREKKHNPPPKISDALKTGAETYAVLTVAEYLLGGYGSQRASQQAYGPSVGYIDQDISQLTPQQIFDHNAQILASKKFKLWAWTISGILTVLITLPITLFLAYMLYNAIFNPPC